MLIKQRKDNQLQCELCWSLFSVKADLEVHMRSHMGDKPFPEENYGMGFTQTGNFNKHRSLCSVLPGSAEGDDQSTEKTGVSDGEKPVYFTSKTDDTNLHNNLNESMVGTSDTLDITKTLTTTGECEHEQNTSESKSNQECLLGKDLERNKCENNAAGQSLCTGSVLEEIVPPQSSVVSVSGTMEGTDHSCEQTGQTDCNKEQDQTACSVQLYTASFNEVQHEHVSLPTAATSISDVNEQQPAVEIESHGANINICSQQNIHIYTGTSTYTHGEQTTCVLKFCNKGEINIQQEAHRSSQIIDSSSVQTESDNTTHGVSLDCKNKDKHSEKQKDMAPANKGMDFCTSYNVKDDFFEQNADKLSFHSSNDYMGDASTVASELGFEHIPNCPGTASETEFQLTGSSFAREQNDCGSGGLKEEGYTYYGPENFNKDNLSGYTNEHVNMSRSTEMSEEDLIPYGPANFSDAEFENYGHGQKKGKDFEQNGPIDIGEKELIRYGPANINEDDFFSYDHSQVRGKDFVFNGPANVNERSFVNHELKDRGKKDFELNGPENIGEKNCVFYGPLNFNETDFVGYGHSKRSKKDCSLDSCVDTCINEGVSYGPANINEDDFARQKDFVLKGPKRLIEKDFISVNPSETSEREFIFNESGSISENRSVSYCPGNANTIDQDQYTSVNETELVQYGPANYHETLHNTETFGEEKLAHTVDLDCNNLLEFPGLVSRDAKQADTCMFPVGTDTAMDHDYVKGSQGPRKVSNTQGYVADGTDSPISNISSSVAPSSFVKAAHFDGSVNPPISNKSHSTDKPKDSSNHLAGEALNHSFSSQETASAVAGLLREESNDCSNGADISEPSNQTQLTCNTPVSHTDSPSTGFTCKDPSKPPQTYLLCEYCGLRVANKSHLNKHLLTHTRKEPFTCSICQKTFTDQSNLHVHMKMCRILNTKPALQDVSSDVQIFSGDSPYMCNICSERFSHKSSLKKHMLSHIKQKLHTCNICSKQFRQKSTLQSHLRTHTGERPFKCNFCDKSFLQSGQLGVHVRSCHTGEKPYVCETCNKGYADKSHYDRHMVTHSGKKPFVCDLCKKAFGQRYQLKAHMKCHDENKQDICHICYKSFSSKNSLKLHLKIHANKM